MVDNKIVNGDMEGGTYSGAYNFSSDPFFFFLKIGELKRPVGIKEP